MKAQREGIRELTQEELRMVSGGVSMTDAVGFGGGAGSAVGIIATNTMRGAAAGGALGAALGFAFGAGYAVGTAIYNGMSGGGGGGGGSFLRLSF